MNSSPDRALELRRWLWAYPAPWRAQHGDQVVGVLLDAEADGEPIGLKDRLNLAAHGLLERIRSVAMVVADASLLANTKASRILPRAALPALASAWVLMLIGVINAFIGVRPMTSWRVEGYIFDAVPIDRRAEGAPILGLLTLILISVTLAALASRKRAIALSSASFAALCAVAGLVTTELVESRHAVSGAVPRGGVALLLLVALVGLALGKSTTLRWRGTLVFVAAVAIALALTTGTFGTRLLFGPAEAALFPLAGLALLVLAVAAGYASRPTSIGGTSVVLLGAGWFVALHEVDSVLRGQSMNLLVGPVLVIVVCALASAFTQARRVGGCNA